MIRIKISIGIILVIITLGITGFFLLDRKTDRVISLIDQTKYLSDSGQKNAALECAEKLIEEWNEYHINASIFVNNDKITMAQSSMSRIISLIEQDVDELNAELDCARSALRWIVESEIPRWTNIL